MDKKSIKVNIDNPFCWLWEDLDIDEFIKELLILKSKGASHIHMALEYGDIVIDSFKYRPETDIEYSDRIARERKNAEDRKKWLGRELKNLEENYPSSIKK